MFSAGEASGDQHAAQVLRALTQMQPEIHTVGLGGGELTAAGAKLNLTYGELAIIGISDILKQAGKFRRALATLTTELTSCDALICVDFGGFNKKLASRAHRLGVPVFYYICPKVWVWGSWRAAGFAKVCDRMLTIFPFEKELWESFGVPATYVGNPILDYLPQPKQLGNIGRIALLPGSRPGEISKLLPIMLAAAKLLRQRRSQIRFVLPSATREINELTEKTLCELDGRDLIERPGIADYYPAIQGCGLALVASGTASLELACLGVPHLLVYKTSAATALFARSVIRQNWIGLPNLIAQREIVPELLQNQLTPANLAGLAEEFLNDDHRRQKQREEGLLLRESLGGGGAGARAAAVILSEIEVADG
jgi:lipid-A-disaccharide synthase